MTKVISTRYEHNTKDLCEIVGKSRWTLIKWEKEGKFTPPRTLGNHRIFTSTQMSEIKNAFSPGGKGYWHFNNSFKTL